MKNLYFDYCSSTPLFPSVQEVILDTYQRVYANSSSMHLPGKETNTLVNECRERIAKILGVKQREVIFTSGATESNNLALFGVANVAKNKLSHPIHIITSSVEHSSIFESAVHLSSEGVEVTFLPVNKSGIVEVTDVQRAIKKNTVLVSIIHVNNETGAIQPVEEIGSMLKSEAPGVYFHVDGVQAFGKLDVNLANMDLYTLSGHKIGGPKGIGILMVKDHVDIAPIQYGGKQESGLRPGTVNVPGVTAITEAMIVTISKQPSSIAKLKKFQNELRHHLSDNSDIIINSPAGALCAPHILNLSYPKSTSALMLNFLGKNGIHLSSQSACSSKGNKISRVIMEMCQDKQISSSSIRISLSADHSEEDIQYLLQCILGMVKSMSENKKFPTIPV